MSRACLQGNMVPRPDAAPIGLRTNMPDRVAAPAAIGDGHLLRSLQKHFPHTLTTLECPLEPILDEVPSEGLPTDRGAEAAVFPNGPVDVRGVDLKSNLAGDVPTLDSQRNNGWLTSSDGRCRRTGPLAVKWASGASIAELPQEQHVSDRSNKQTLHLPSSNGHA
jgi:hypothetical protein